MPARPPQGASYCRAVYPPDGLVASAPLPTPITVAYDVPAAVLPTVIGGLHVSVHLPVDDGEVHLLRPHVLDWLPAEPEYASHNDPDDDLRDSPWGWVTVNDDPPKRVLALAQVVFVVPDVEPDDVKTMARVLLDGFAGWFEHVRSWCEVLTNQDLDHHAPRPSVTVQGHGWEAWAGDEHHFPFGGIRFNFGDGAPVTRDQLARIVDLAGRSVMPATEQLLLRDSRAALDRGQFRRSVVDAGTAMEMSLYKILEAVCAADSSPVADHYLKLAGKWTLGTLIGNLSNMCELPAGLTRDTVGLRNQVIHKTAYEPTKDQATSWLELATATADLANPAARSLPS